MSDTLRTERLVLRPPRPDDLDALHAVFSDRDAMRYWSHEAHRSREATRRTLEEMMASFARTRLEFVLVRDGEVIGKAGLWRRAEIGCILAPAHWGKGLMREALRAVLDAAFARHSTLTTIHAEIDPRNEACERLLTALGFHETGREARTLFLYDEWCDSAFWQLERPQAVA